MQRNMNRSVCTYLLAVAFLATFKMAESRFSMAFYDSIYVPRTTDSVFISPLGLKATLAVAALAAKGQTQKEILQSLESSPETLDDDVMLPGNIGNLRQQREIYVTRNLDAEQLKNKLAKAYEFRYVHFGPRNVAKELNYRVQDATKRWVGDILPNSLNKDTALAAVNSMYLHSEWKKQFTSTMKRGFKKPMVHQYGDFLYANLTDLNAAALVLEFAKNDAILLVLQPNDNDLQRLSEKLLNVDLTELPKRLKTTYMSLYFPIIKEIKLSLNVKDTMRDMGIDRAYSYKANFGKIVDRCEDDNGLHLKALRQHTSFKSGRESARFVAVTGLQMDMNNATRNSCSCLPDDYVTEFADPNEIEEKLDLSYRNKDAPHYYFEHKLFFALIHGKDILFVGTLAKEK